MANKPRNPIKLSPKMTNEQMQELAKMQEEEQMMKRLAYFAQRREGIATNIMCSIIRDINGKENLDPVVDKAVDLADKLLEKLYPKPEDKK